MSAPRNEQKYQLIKLVKSGRTLSETRSEVKAASTALHPEYVSQKDLTALAKLEGFNHLILTRGQAIDLMRIKFPAARAYPSTRAEAVAKFVSGYRGNLPLNWKRDGNLIRRGSPNKPQPGSSAGKVGVRVSGAQQTLNELQHLVKTLQKLQREHGRGNTKALQKAYKSVRTQVMTAARGKG